MSGLAAEVSAACPPLNEWRKFIYCYSMTGRVLGEVDHFKGEQGVAWEWTFKIYWARRG